MKGSDVPVQGAVLRLFYGFPGVYEDHGVHIVDSTQEGHPPSPIPRRLVSTSRATTEGIRLGTDSASVVRKLRVRINREKSSLQPGQRMVFLGVDILSSRLKAFPSQA